MDAGKQATEKVLNEAAKKEEVAIKKEEATAKSMPVVKEHLKTKAEEVHEKIRNILAEHNNMESDIPFGNEYWKLLNEYRALTAK